MDLGSPDPILLKSSSRAIGTLIAGRSCLMTGTINTVPSTGAGGQRKSMPLRKQECTAMARIGTNGQAVRTRSAQSPSLARRLAAQPLLRLADPRNLDGGGDQVAMRSAGLGPEGRRAIVLDGDPARRRQVEIPALRPDGV